LNTAFLGHAAAAASFSTGSLVAWLQGLIAPVFLGIVAICGIFFLFSKEILRFVQFVILAIIIAVIFYTPTIIRTLALGITHALGLH